MDQLKTGKFIARLRKAKGLTQEELGRRVFVSNKTVSRWENGNYMPDIHTLQLLSKEFSVSVDELLEGENFPLEKTKKKADSFSQKERVDFWRRNWKRENFSWFIFWGIALAVITVFGYFIFGAAAFISASIFSLALYFYFHNKMCAYVENNAYKLSDDR